MGLLGLYLIARTVCVGLGCTMMGLAARSVMPPSLHACSASPILSALDAWVTSPSYKANALACPSSTSLIWTPASNAQSDAYPAPEPLRAQSATRMLPSCWWVGFASVRLASMWIWQPMGNNVCHVEQCPDVSIVT